MILNGVFTSVHVRFLLHFVPVMILVVSLAFLPGTQGVANLIQAQGHPFTVRTVIRGYGVGIYTDHDCLESIDNFSYPYEELQNGVAIRKVYVRGTTEFPFYYWMGYSDGSSPLEPVPPFHFYLKWDNPNSNVDEVREVNLTLLVTGPPFFGSYAFEVICLARMRGDVLPWESVGDDIIDMRDIGFAAREIGRTNMDPEWMLLDAIVDFNRDDVIDMSEITYLTAHFGDTSPKFY